MPHRAEDLVHRLIALGLDEREAKLYVHLSLAGPSRASDAAAAARLKRTETYRALEALTRRGYVTAHLTRPVRYEAVHPDALFTQLLQQHDERRGEMERLRERVSAMLHEARDQRVEGAGRHGFKIIQGRRAIHVALDAAIRQAKGSQVGISTHFRTEMANAQNRAYQSTLARAADGLPMRLLLRDSPGIERALAPLASRPNVRIRFIDAPHTIRFSIIDGREIVYWLVSDPSSGVEAREDVAMWTNAPEFIQAQQAFFESLWAGAREVVPVPRA